MASGIEAEIRKIGQELSRAGIETPLLDARLLVQAATGRSYENIVAEPDRELAPGQRDILGQFLERRLAREPVSRILGLREFYGRDFLVTPHVLDPRPDSEVLVEAALSAAESHLESRPPRLLDLGTGTGCLLISLLCELPFATGVGVDISPEALQCANQNAERLGVGERASFVCGSWLAPLEGEVDLIIANPPYIRTKDISGLQPEVAQYDPVLALDGGDEGLAPYRAIMAEAGKVLRPGGSLLFEIGAGQSEDVRRIMQAAGVIESYLYQDLAGINRVVQGRFTGNSS